MSDNFIQYNRCEKAKWLRKNYPNAFLLLSLIAENARRTSGHIDGLIPGDALIGKPEDAGLSRQSYRTALEKLVELQIIKIISNGKKFFEREKSTIKATITGHLVNLLDSEIWNINKEDSNQQSNQRPTNDQPTTNHKQERIKKEKKEKKSNLVISADAEKLLFFFNSSLKQFIPEIADPDETNPSKSAKYFDELIKKGHSIPEIQAVITFAHKDDDFWPQYVHTPQYLKTKFAKILSKMRRGNPAKKNQQTDRTPKGPNGTQFENPHAGKF